MGAAIHSPRAWQSHIDMAWLWPWTETVEVVRNTFSSALQLMRQYPDVYYSQSTAAAFQWMEEKYPALFQQIQQRVKEGRWEIVGGMSGGTRPQLALRELAGAASGDGQALLSAEIRR